MVDRPIPPPIHTAGVGGESLCKSCANYVRSELGGGTCGVDALRITQTWSCRWWDEDTLLKQCNRAFALACDDMIRATGGDPAVVPW